MDAINLPNIAMFTLPAVVILILLEAAISSLRRQPVYTLTDSGVSLFMLALQLFIIPVSFFSVMAWMYQYRLFDIGSSILALAGLYVVQDFFYYWSHRFGHRCRIAWASHVVHHSSEKLNIMTSWRLESFGGPISSWIYWSPIALLGFHPVAILFIYSIKIVYANVCHTQMIGKLPRWYEFIFSTPSHHRVHHGSNPEYLDRNYGSTFIIWDRMFGTFAEEDPANPVVYGLTKQLKTNNVFVILFHEWVSIVKDVWSSTRWSSAFKYVFYPPGWQHTPEHSKAR